MGYIKLLDERSVLIREMNEKLDEMDLITDKELRKIAWIEYEAMMLALQAVEAQMIQN